ncbi:hypothetical protein [Carboxydothermus pertinax]|uniref:Uncharacterized protein n=1 Tax=Carboxydothermus pertinax TaxID=870242 RepID=A0A1L8CRJ9_9THEO|nr:hypothetical protein [Carboxydothermus pertinax]GAV21523.1 hypothetical protein cpu_00330 [Carboxydothermus pertinax]
MQDVNKIYAQAVAESLLQPDWQWYLLEDKIKNILKTRRLPELSGKSLPEYLADATPAEFARWVDILNRITGPALKEIILEAFREKDLGYKVLVLKNIENIKGEYLVDLMEEVAWEQVEVDSLIFLTKKFNQNALDFYFLHKVKNRAQELPLENLLPESQGEYKKALLWLLAQTKSEKAYRKILNLKDELPREYFNYLLLIAGGEKALEVIKEEDPLKYFENPQEIFMLLEGLDEAMILAKITEILRPEDLEEGMRFVMASILESGGFYAEAEKYFTLLSNLESPQSLYLKAKFTLHQGRQEEAREIFLMALTAMREQLLKSPNFNGGEIEELYFLGSKDGFLTLEETANFYADLLEGALWFYGAITGEEVEPIFKEILGVTLPIPVEEVIKELTRRQGVVVTEKIIALKRVSDPQGLISRRIARKILPSPLAVDTVLRVFYGESFRLISNYRDIEKYLQNLKQRQGLLLLNPKLFDLKALIERFQTEEPEAIVHSYSPLVNENEPEEYEKLLNYLETVWNDTPNWELFGMSVSELKELSEEKLLN